MHTNITTISASEMSSLSWPLIRWRSLIYLQATFIHLIAPLLGGHPRVGTSKYQAGGLVQSLKVPSSSSWNWCSQQYKPIGSIKWISSAGAQVCCGLSYPPGPSCSAQVAPWELGWCCAFLNSYCTSKLNLCLSSPPLGNSTSPLPCFSLGFLILQTCWFPFFHPLSPFCASRVWAQLRLL